MVLEVSKANVLIVEDDKTLLEVENDILMLAGYCVTSAQTAEQAGALLSRLETDIAAKILLKMNSRKAGAACGFVEPTKAALISKKLAIYNAGKK